MINYSDKKFRVDLTQEGSAMKKTIFSIAFIFSSILALSAHAAVVNHTDSFDDLAATTAWWGTPYQGTWTHPVISGSDLGYLGVYDGGDDGTAVFADNDNFFFLADLTVSFDVRVPDDDSAAGFLIIDRTVAGTNTYNEYAIIIERNAGSSDRLEIWYNSSISGSETNTSMAGIDIPEIDPSAFYHLTLSSDSSSNFGVFLYEGSAATNPIGELAGVPLTDFSSGIMGIAANDTATFNTFSFTGNSVPAPGAFLLFGSGLLGLLGARRRFSEPA